MQQNRILEYMKKYFSITKSRKKVRLLNDDDETRAKDGSSDRGKDRKTEGVNRNQDKKSDIDKHCVVDID